MNCHRLYKRKNKGAILLGVMLVIILIGISLLTAQFYSPTQKREEKEEALEFKLSELRKALFEALNYEHGISGENQIVSSFIYDIKSLPFDADTGETILKDKIVAKYGFTPFLIDRETPSVDVQDFLITVLKGEGYLRTDYKVPLLEGYSVTNADGSVDEDIRVGWRIAENMLASASFEEDINERPMKMEELEDFDNVSQYWFSTSDQYENVHCTTVVEPPPSDDYPGQKDTFGSRGKFGKKVMILKLPD